MRQISIKVQSRNSGFFFIFWLDGDYSHFILIRMVYGVRRARRYSSEWNFFSVHWLVLSIYLKKKNCGRKVNWASESESTLSSLSY